MRGNFSLLYFFRKEFNLSILSTPSLSKSFFYFLSFYFYFYFYRDNWFKTSISIFFMYRIYTFLGG